MDVSRSTISGGAWTRRQNGHNRRKTPCKTATAKKGVTVHPSGGGLKPLTKTENTLGLEFGFTALSLSLFSLTHSNIFFPHMSSRNSTHEF